jgi:hypothetical protein
MEHLKQAGVVAKAIAGAIAAAIGSLLLVLQGNETFADVNTVEWLTVALNVLGTFGVVYRIPNHHVG